MQKSNVDFYPVLLLSILADTLLRLHTGYWARAGLLALHYAKGGALLCYNITTAAAVGAGILAVDGDLLGAAVGGFLKGQDHIGLNVMALARCVGVRLTGRTAKAAETSISAISPIASGIPITACTSGISVFAFIHNLLIGLLYFFKPGFRLITHGVVDIRIGMVLSAQRPVCFFYLFIGCIP